MSDLDFFDDVTSENLDPTTMSGLFISSTSTSSVKPKSTDWQDPLPISTKLLPVMPFHDRLLPESLLKYVKAEASSMPCNVEYVAVSLLAALGITIGTRVGIKPKQHDDWMVVAPLSGAVIGEPSMKKSPAVAKGLKPLAHLRHFEHTKLDKALAEYRHQVHFHDAQLKSLKAQLKAAEKACDFDQYEQIAKDIVTTQEYAPQQPKSRRIKTDDATWQAVLKLLVDNPYGMMVFQDELIAWLARLDKDSNASERGMYLQGANGLDTYEIDRVGTGPLVIPRHCVVVFGCIQPDVLCKYLANAINQGGNDGLFQRIQLMAFPDPVPWSYRDHEVNSVIQDRVNRLFERSNELSADDLIHMGASPADQAGSIPFFRFTDEAQALFIQWTTHLHTETMTGQINPILAQHFGKYDKLMSALALMFHIVEYIETGYRGGVSLRSAQYAADWCAFLESHARRIYGMISSQSIKSAAKLAEMLQQLVHNEPEHIWIKDGFTASQVLPKDWSGLGDVKTIKEALETLVDHHWLIAIPKPTGPRGGRPSVRYWINPKLSDKSPAQ